VHEGLQLALDVVADVVAEGVGGTWWCDEASRALVCLVGEKGLFAYLKQPLFESTRKASQPASLTMLTRRSRSSLTLFLCMQAT
jgi:hypothetical protein